MQNISLDVELQRTLNELCLDLFATSASDDCNATLRSLALLAETFPQAQTLLGRLLSQNDDSQDRPRHASVTRLSALSTNFLYRKETAYNAIAFFSALSKDNIRNQRRIVQSVTGVKLDIDPNKYGQSRGTLYALTVPAAVTNTYRSWRKRQRELHNCRLPTGAPPAHDGIPAPCYCDCCLGADQFLSTWQQHFHDLSRWSQGSDKQTSRNGQPPFLSTEEFFRIFLADHQAHMCTVEEVLGPQKITGGSGADRTDRHRSVVYYFVSPEELAVATPRTQVQFDPLRHISAIAIAAEIDIAAERRACAKVFQQDTNRTDSTLSGPVKSNALAPEQVILLTTSSEIEACIAISDEASESDEDLPRFRAPAGSNECFLADLLRIEEQYGQVVQCDLLRNYVRSDDSQLTEMTEQLLLHLLSFCDCVDQIPLSAFRRNSKCDPGIEQLKKEEVTFCETKYVESAPLQFSAKIIMTANLSEQILRVDCFSEGCSPRAFSTSVPKAELMSVGSAEDESSLSLLCLSDEALKRLLQRCRICTCDSEKAHVEAGTFVYLRRICPEGEERSDTNSDVDSNAQLNPAPKSSPAGCISFCGLSFQAKHELEKLEKRVSGDNYRRVTGGDLTDTIKKLARVVTDCNKRISYLSVARDKELVRAVPEVNRAAAISRCRHCRDLLIQLGKKLALKVKPLDITVPISQTKLSGVAKVIRRSIHDILAHSESFDAWETPDARVEKLNLDRRLWASGFPDAAYYQDASARQRENRKMQQQLSQRLLLQQRKKASKDVSRARQRGG